MSERQVFAKCAWRLIPFMVLLYLVNFIDRVNVGFAALTMNKDLGFSPTTYGFGAGIFFFSYALSQLPANLMFTRLGARRWIFAILAVWGIISAGNAFVQGPLSFYTLRFALGVAEAGFFPGMIFYLTLWFPQAYRARFTAMFMASQQLSFIVGGPLSGFVLGLDGAAGLHGWQWLFLIEGLPATLLAFAVLKFLPDRPASARWLSDDEKIFIAARLSAEASVSRRDLWPALHDPRVLLLGIAFLGLNAGAYGVGLWLPQIVQGMGYSIRATGFLVTLPFIASMCVMIVWGRSSDTKGERTWHVALPILIAAGAFIAAALSPADLVVLIALSVAVVGIDAVNGPFWSLVSSFLSGPAAAGGIAAVRTISAFGGVAGPYLVGVFKQETGGYGASMAGLAATLVLAALVVLGVGAFAPRKVRLS